MGRCATLFLLCCAPLAHTERCLSLDGSFEPTVRREQQQQPRVTLEVGDWDSHQLLTEAAKIMIEEVLAVEVITSAHDAGLAVYERVATGIVDANVEVWTDGKAEERARWRCDSQSCRCSYQEETNCAVEEAHGFDGHTGVYVAHDDAASTCEYTVTDRPQLPDWDFALYQLCRVQDGGVTRLISPRLERRLPEVWTLLQSFRIGRTEVEEILRKHPSHPDSTAASIHEAACEWLRESPETWGPWVTAAVERAQLKPNVTIGLVFPAQEFGDVDEQLQLAGAQLAIEHVNQDETILRGVRLQPLLVPSSLARLLNSNKGTAEYIADEAQSLNQRLLQGGAVAVVGAGYSSDVKALAPAIELPILSPSATAAALSNTTAYPRFGRLCISDKFQAQALADIVQFYGFQRIGMIFCDDVYCEGLAAGTKAELAASGVRVEFEQRIRSKMQGGDLDAVIALLEKDLTSCADGADEHTTATLLITHEYELLLGASAKAELKTAWIGSESLGSNGQAGPKSLQSGAVSLRQSADLDNARYDAFVSGVPSAAQDLFAVNAYDAVWAYAHAMEALYAQGISVYDQTELLEQLAALNFRGASGSVVFDESIDRRGSYQIVSFLNGELQVVGSWTAVDRSISASKQLDFDTSPNKYRPCADSNESDNLMTIALAAVGIVLVVLAPIIWFVTIWRRRLRLSRQSFTTFLSHTKDEGAAHAMSLNASFDKALLRRSCCCLPSGRGDNFIDTRTLNYITPEQLVESVKKSKVFVLLLTKRVLTRPWCLLEIYAALDADIPIVPIKVIGLYERDQYSYGKNAGYLANLATNVFDQEYMQQTFGIDAWAPDVWVPIESCSTIKPDEAQELQKSSSLGEEAGQDQDVAAAAGEALSRLQRTISTPHGQGLTLQDVQELIARKQFTSYKAEEFKPGGHPEVISAQTSVIVARIKEELRMIEQHGDASQQQQRSARATRAWKRVKHVIMVRKALPLQKQRRGSATHKVYAVESHTDTESPADTRPPALPATATAAKPWAGTRLPALVPPGAKPD